MSIATESDNNRNNRIDPQVEQRPIESELSSLMKLLHLVSKYKLGELTARDIFNHIVTCINLGSYYSDGLYNLSPGMRGRICYLSPSFFENFFSQYFNRSVPVKKVYVVLSRSFPEKINEEYLITVGVDLFLQDDFDEIEGRLLVGRYKKEDDIEQSSETGSYDYVVQGEGFLFGNSSKD